jgi:uncharacterized protein YciI
MPIYIVRMEHPAGPLWNEFVLEHISYLKFLIDKGSLLASGPVKGSPLRAGFLIFEAATAQAVQALIDDDPFARENIISAMTIEEWDPLFGALAEHSSKQSVDVLVGKS